MRLLLLLLIGAILIQTKNFCNDPIAIDEHTDRVCRRWYLVERLTKPMKLLEKLYIRHEKKLFPIPLPTELNITDPVVNNCLKELITEKKIKPVIQLWQQISCYKFASQETLPSDFSIMICFLLRHCCVRLHELHIEDEMCEQIGISYETLVSWDTVKVLDLVARFTNYLKGKKFACLINSRVNNIANSRFIDIGTKDISLRYCLVSRLKKTFDWFSIFKNKKISFFRQLMTREHNSVVVDEYVSLYHPRIVTCSKEMAQTESLAPFIALWKQFKCFEDIHDVEFLKDFLKLVFVTYHYLFLGNMFHKNQNIDYLVKEMQNWSAHINEFSLMQILDVIDVIEHSCDQCKVFGITSKQLHKKLKKKGRV